MGLIPKEQKQQLKEDFEKNLKGEVRILVFTQETECPFCKQSRELAEEVGAFSNKIKVEVYDFVKDSEKAKEYQIDKVPAIAVLGKKDYGIRFYGLTYGYEFRPFTESIINVSRGATNLSEETKKKLASIENPVHIQVFVSLTCPYCPLVTSLAHQFAVESDLVRADMVDVSEFPYLGQKYNIMGVPKTVINEKTEFVGAVPEELFVQQVVVAQRSPTMYV
ncbi:MAG: thioredoxin family protein [Candidatus Bathyarchaeota archaeon]|nr:thioredoxin family protein [Candidatus Bathyarchaeota archaeon]MDH5418818.1 thioredoxin family protein [Candidatus Bathyarchaeota archaeon]MDH5623187.1 thioredoxin family protein [Candidatus Bathyarchaeota archaeon]MDH5635148.1 thioredoxin family protein [Candidatus Bathyarchaeota archaeon]MDH5701348.1 thioredoxin family protein [Candidatus Bathyarchaeota archaeon]